MVLGESNKFIHSVRWNFVANDRHSNKADLRLLEEMGITPDTTVKEKKTRSLRSVGIAVIATVRMQKMQAAWAGNKKLHESLMKKLEGLRRKSGQAQAQIRSK